MDSASPCQRVPLTKSLTYTRTYDVYSGPKGEKHKYGKTVYEIINMSKLDIKTNCSLQTLENKTRKGYSKMKMKYLALHALPDLSETEEELKVCLVNNVEHR